MPEIAGNRDIAAVRAPQDVVAIVRVDFGVAETGSVLLSDRELRVNALAYLTQHLIVLLDPADILVNCITRIAGRSSATAIMPPSMPVHPPT